MTIKNAIKRMKKGEIKEFHMTDGWLWVEKLSSNDYVIEHHSFKGSNIDTLNDTLSWEELRNNFTDYIIKGE